MSMSWVYNLQNVIQCLGALLGMGMGVFLLSVSARWQASWLWLASFCSASSRLPGLLLNVLINLDIGGEAFNYIYPCITAPAFLWGALPLAPAFFLMVRPDPQPT